MVERPPKSTKIHRSSQSGEFVKKDTAKKNPKTVTENTKKKK
jgi:hypothetical protein